MMTVNIKRNNTATASNRGRRLGGVTPTAIFLLQGAAIVAAAKADYPNEVTTEEDATAPLVLRGQLPPVLRGLKKKKKKEKNTTTTTTTTTTTPVTTTTTTTTPVTTTTTPATTTTTTVPATTTTTTLAVVDETTTTTTTTTTPEAPPTTTTTTTPVTTGTTTTTPAATTTLPKVKEVTKDNWDGSTNHDHFPLGLCEGECDRNRDCAGDLICYQRGSGHAVPGCSGVPSSRSDFCIDPQALIDAIPYDFDNDDFSGKYEGTSTASRLRLFWHEIYYWQEKRDETFWCMQCEGPCEEERAIKINHCDETKARQYFIADGETIRPQLNTTLCMTETGFDKEVLPVQLMPCDGATNQNFWGYRDQGPFQLRPRTSTSTKLTHCLTQHHHPKAHEAVYPRTCTIVEDNDTSLWTRY